MDSGAKLEVYDISFRSWVKSNVRVGIRRAGKATLFEISAAARTRLTALLFRPGTQAHLKLDVGCGANRRDGWVNVDLHPAADVKTDARRRLPFRTGSAAIIYSEHFFEHLEYPEEAVLFLSESFRVLEPGGLFSVGVPDTELILRAYVNGNFSRRSLGLTYVEWCDMPMHSLNFLFHQGGEHKHLYDAPTLINVLNKAGFENVRRREFDPGIDSESRRIGTLYVEARKPR